MPLFVPTSAQAQRIFVSGLYYTFDSSGGDNTVVTAAGTASLSPFTVDVGHTFNQVSLEVTVTAASSTVDLAIYNDNAGAPGTLLTDFGAIDSHTGTGVIVIAISQLLVPGRYWLGSLPLAGTPTVRGRSTANLSNIGQSTGVNANVTCLQLTGLAVWPATGASFTPAQPVVPKVMLRAA